MSSREEAARAARLGRFLLTVAAGALLDLAVSMALARALRAPLTAAAAGGFAAGLALNYVLFERWTFRDGDAPARRFSPSRFAATAGAAALALAVRLGVVSLLGSVLARSPATDLVRLASAMAASFAVNYALTRLIFTGPRGPGARDGAVRSPS